MFINLCAPQLSFGETISYMVLTLLLRLWFFNSYPLIADLLKTVCFSFSKVFVPFSMGDQFRHQWRKTGLFIILTKKFGLFLLSTDDPVLTG